MFQTTGLRARSAEFLSQRQDQGRFSSEHSDSLAYLDSFSRETMCRFQPDREIQAGTSSDCTVKRWIPSKSTPVCSPAHAPDWGRAGGHFAVRRELDIHHSSSAEIVPLRRER